MSIEMKNPKTVFEKIEAAENLVAQMLLSHSVRDDGTFNMVHKKASELLFDAKLQIEKESVTE